MRNIYDTTPSKIKINLPFEIKYHYGKQNNNNQSTSNNIVYYIELFVKNDKSYGTLLIHQTKIVVSEDDFFNVSIDIRQLKEEHQEHTFPNYL